MKALKTVVIALSILLLASCQNPFVAQNLSGDLSVSIASPSSKTIKPADLAIASYSLSGGGPSGATIPSSSSTTGTFSFSGLAVGDWNVTVSGLDGSGTAIATGTATVTVSANTAASATINLKPLSTGSGSLSLTVSWPNTKTVSAVTASLTPISGGTSTALGFTISGSSAVSTKSGLPVGAYLLSIKLTSSGSTLCPHGDMVLIYANKSSEGSVSLAESDFVSVFKLAYVDTSATSGSVPVDGTIYLPGNKATVLGNPNTLAASGKVFCGWNTKPDGTGTNYAAGDSLTVSGNTSLYSVWLNSSDITISGTAITGCSTSLSSLIIPPSVISIEDNAFAFCMSLTSVTIPSSVISIGAHAFDDCMSLTNVTIPSSVTSIGAHAFEGCNSLMSVTIPLGVTSIAASAFDNCTSLTSVTIPSGVTSIGDSAFDNCTSLTSVTIPSGVTSIGDSAFYYCTKLDSVTVNATSPPTLWGDRIFDSNKSGRKIYVPSASVSDYQKASYWNEYKDDIVSIE
jgi:hypothetical protein